MNKTKFENETFDFNLTLVTYDKDKKKECKKVEAFLMGIGYDKSVALENIETAFAFCCHDKGDFYIIFNIGSYKCSKKKNNIRQIKTLAHECTHVKEGVLENIAERDNNKETESAQRITDWCFMKCLQTKHFKSMFK